MRRLALLLIALIGLAAPSIAQQSRDWRTAIAQTPSGSYVVGNPAAPVKLVEYVSYTCPHCAHFLGDSKAVLKDHMVRNGSVRVELRHIIFNGLDLSAVLLARCAGPRGFVGATDAMYASQPEWVEKAMTFQRANAEKLKGAAPLVQLKALADGSGLSDLMKKRGMSAATINACFAKDSELKRVTEMSKAGLAKIQGTPAFEINGSFQSGISSWSELEPKLRAAGAR